MLKKALLLVPIALLLGSPLASAHERDTRLAIGFRGPSLVALAYDLDRSARELSTQARSEIFPRGRKRVEALAAIRQFEIDARRFRSVVEDRIRGSRLAWEVERLERSFDRTAFALERNVRPSRFLVEDFRRVERSMDRLTGRF
jgi:hypothetical protein